MHVSKLPRQMPGKMHTPHTSLRPHSPQSSPAERYPPAPKLWSGSACAVVQAEELVARARLQSVEATEWHRLAAGRWCEVEAL